ncbi:MAG: hypothetical protein MI919_04770, partial [Holophagales bacterium]|nr:hypothetical protein [Holophagales bacterium]
DATHGTEPAHQAWPPLPGSPEPASLLPGRATDPPFPQGFRPATLCYDPGVERLFDTEGPRRPDQQGRCAASAPRRRADADRALDERDPRASRQTAPRPLALSSDLTHLAPYTLEEGLPALGFDQRPAIPNAPEPIRRIPPP